ncbi:MAG TPA: hypothetical protein VGB52_11920 [Actinomycetota bacterium]
MGKIKRVTATSTLTGLLVAAPAAAALAHECFIVNRSEAGSVNAGHAGKWVVIDLEEILVGEFGIDEAGAALIVADAGEAGVPTLFSIYAGPTLAGRSSHMNEAGAGDGKGIDWFFSGPYFGTLGEILASYGIEIPEEG